MAEVVIRTPVPDYTGSVGALHFTRGRAVADDEVHVAEIAYCHARGYYFGEDEGDSGADEAPDAPAQPRKSASKADWLAYAVSRGMSADEAESLTRDQLVERFTSNEEDEQ